MGYTHYFDQQRDLTATEFAQIGEAARKIIAKSNVRIVREYDLPDELPEITDEFIAFNGVGNDGHETMWLQPKSEGFAFCKTARKPYDVAVVALLCAVHAIAPDAYRIGADGDVDDWEDGAALAREACPALNIQIPITD
jgi:hypothetical protein